MRAMVYPPDLILLLHFADKWLMIQFDLAAAFMSLSGMVEISRLAAQ
jgi:hypothetical protein